MYLSSMQTGKFLHIVGYVVGLLSIDFLLNLIIKSKKLWRSNLVYLHCPPLMSPQKLCNIKSSFMFVDLLLPSPATWTPCYLTLLLHESPWLVSASICASFVHSSPDIVCRNPIGIELLQVFHVHQYSILFFLGACWNPSRVIQR